MKKKVVLLLSLVLVALCVARIAFVNATAIRFEARRHAVGGGHRAVGVLH